MYHDPTNIKNSFQSMMDIYVLWSQHFYDDDDERSEKDFFNDQPLPFVIGTRDYIDHDDVCYGDAEEEVLSLFFEYTSYCFFTCRLYSEC